MRERRTVKACPFFAKAPAIVRGLLYLATWSTTQWFEASSSVFETRLGALAYACWPGLKPVRYMWQGSSSRIVYMLARVGEKPQALRGGPELHSPNSWAQGQIIARAITHMRRVIAT